MKIFHNRNQFIIGSYICDGIETHPYKTYGIVSMMVDCSLGTSHTQRHASAPLQNTNQHTNTHCERKTMRAKENEITFVRLTKHTHFRFFSNICSFEEKKMKEFAFCVRIVCCYLS